MSKYRHIFQQLRDGLRLYLLERFKGNKWLHVRGVEAFMHNGKLRLRPFKTSSHVYGPFKFSREIIYKVSDELGVLLMDWRDYLTSGKLYLSDGVPYWHDRVLVNPFNDVVDHPAHAVTVIDRGSLQLDFEIDYGFYGFYDGATLSKVKRFIRYCHAADGRPEWRLSLGAMGVHWKARRVEALKQAFIKARQQRQFGIAIVLRSKLRALGERRIDALGHFPDKTVAKKSIQRRMKRKNLSERERNVFRLMIAKL